MELEKEKLEAEAEVVATCPYSYSMPSLNGKNAAAAKRWPKRNCGHLHYVSMYEYAHRLQVCPGFLGLVISRTRGDRRLGTAVRSPEHGVWYVALKQAHMQTACGGGIYVSLGVVVVEMSSGC